VGGTYRDDVQKAEGEDDNARADDDAPNGHAERVLRGGWFVQVAEDLDAED